MSKVSQYWRGFLHGLLFAGSAYVLTQWYADHVMLAKLVQFLQHLQ